MVTEFLEEILTTVISFMIPVLEMMGVFVVAVGAAQSFFKYLKSGFKADNTELKLGFAETLAMALEFKMGGEILKTVITKTINEMWVLAAIIILRAILTFVIHWEIKQEKNAKHVAGKEEKAVEEK
ncbi:MAG: DUF1622 domain-containing protein [Lachnospiraceae bacterium]|nr:DUF1622 domain-containing protein [Lachnospiraceae bacterium]